MKIDINNKNFKIISKETGYIYDVLGIQINKKSRLKAYKINNQGRIEWWDNTRFNVIEKKEITKKYYTYCDDCKKYIPIEIVEEYYERN